MALRNEVQLIAYPDRIGNNLGDLALFLEKHLEGLVGGVHILPIYPSNADTGFSPLTHMDVDPAYGSWADIERISSRIDLCLDLIINHMSDESAEFLDFIEKGDASQYADLFLDVDRLGTVTPDDLAKIYIRKEREPFRDVVLADGSKRRVWCTFTDHQIDLNYGSLKTYNLMERYIEFLAARGVKLFRLDAFGYATKRIGTNCFMVEPDIYKVLDWFHATGARYGAQMLPEVHDHISYQYALQLIGMRPYGFALPPLILHAFLRGTSMYLTRWLRMCPRDQITVLDTHDGICIPDVEGMLPGEEVRLLIDEVQKRSTDPVIRRTAVNVDSVGAIYQLTCTFYEALFRNDDAYIAARAIQFFTPGIPQVYYVGLFASTNNFDEAKKTGEPRDVNRHHYTWHDIDENLQKPVVQRLLALMRFRNHHSAFAGDFVLEQSDPDRLSMAWYLSGNWCRLRVDLSAYSAWIDTSEGESFCC